MTNAAKDITGIVFPANDDPQAEGYRAADYWQSHVAQERMGNAGIPQDAANEKDHTLTQEQKDVINKLPEDVQQQIYLMLRRDPSIARVLTEAVGKEHEITQAVRIGYSKGQRTVDEQLVHPSEDISDVSANALSKRLAKERVTRRQLAQKYKTEGVYSELQGVAPDFMPLAIGAFHNAIEIDNHHHDVADDGEDKGDDDGHDKQPLFHLHIPRPPSSGGWSL